MTRNAHKRTLTDTDVLVIRQFCKLNSKTHGSLAISRMFGVARNTIERIVKRETYRHLGKGLTLRKTKQVQHYSGYVSENVPGTHGKPWACRPDADGALPVSWLKEYTDSHGWTYYRNVDVLVTPTGEVIAHDNIEDYAAKYRERTGIEQTKPKRVRRTKRQLAWWSKFALPKGVAGPAEIARRLANSEREHQQWQEAKLAYMFSTQGYDADDPQMVEYKRNSDAFHQQRVEEIKTGQRNPRRPRGGRIRYKLYGE